MSHLFWLDQERLNRIKHMFPKPRGVARADDRKVLSGIIHVIRNGLRWRDAPSDYGPHKTLYNRWARWSQMGVFARILPDNIPVCHRPRGSGVVLVMSPEPKRIA